MRVLLDECVPRRFKRELIGHETKTSETAWSFDPWLELPHGIEYKRGPMTDARRWWWRDRALLANYANKYGAVAGGKFAEQGCVA